MKRSYKSVAVAAGLWFSASSAFAGEPLATLSEVQSPVMVNQGDAYVPAREGMKLGNGDQLLVMQGGATLVNYATGCQLKLGGNEVLRIAATDACSAPAVAAINAQVSPPATTTVATGTGLSTGATIAAVGAAVVTAGVVINEVVDNNDSDSDPISR